jgi:hypothetical protein
MAKIKQSSTQDPGRRTTIQERIASAANMFTQEILVILGSSTLAELTEVSQDSGLPVIPDVRSQSQEKSKAKADGPRPKKKVLDFLKVIGRMAVQCPVKGCTNRGVRSKMNFCAEHALSIPPDEQRRLREIQKAEHEKRPTLPGRSAAPAPKARAKAAKRSAA